MPEEKEKHRIWVGFDESNHGEFPEVDVAVLSQLEKDLKERALSKIKRNLKCPRLGSKRDFTFLLFNEADHDAIMPKERFGYLISSLLIEDVPSDYSEPLDIYIDGKWRPSFLEFTRDHVSELLYLPKEQINVYCGKALDIKLPLVNYADNIARWIHKTWTPEKIAKSDKKRVLLR